VADDAKRIIGRRRFLGIAGLGAAGAVLAACSKGQAEWQAGPGGPSGPSGSVTPTTPVPTTPAGAPVHVRLYQGDGSTWGIGMPIIAYISKNITDARPFAAATKVTVNGSPAQGAWFFQKSAIYPDYPLEAHWRPQQYWPAHAQIRMELPVQGLSGGTGWLFDNSLTLDMATGPANIARIDGKSLRMVVTSDGNQVFSFPVSLGKASTPTFNGVKVVMEKHDVQEMRGADYDLKVPWSVRITLSGEFIHSASWNGGNIGTRSTSHGCTNLREADAKNYFNFVQIGDVAEYTNTGGPLMPSWDGYGDWNLPWSTWSSGGLLAVV
jgi:lipoprotein-anchoring transpeptidase ErfK/SrfK